MAAVTKTIPRSTKPARLPTLQVSRNGVVLQKLSLDSPRLLIGRSEDSDISIPSRYVSRYHILLVRHGRRTILVDLNSTNGSYVNAERVYNHVLTDGDVISLDRQSVYVRYSIEFLEPGAGTRGAADDVTSAAGAIDQAMASIRHLLDKGDTDLLPTPHEDVPTEIGFVDDR